MKNFWSKILTGFATLVTVLALGANAQAAPLSGQPNVGLDFNGTGQTANYTVGLTTTTPVGGDLVRDGKIKVDFPAGFDISSASLAALPPLSLLGSVDNLSVVGQSLSFQFHHDGGLPDGSTVSFGVNGVINPAISGSYHLAISTLQIDNSLVDGATNSFDFSIQPRGPNQANSTLDTNPSGITTMTVGSTVNVIFTAKDGNNVVMPNQEVAWSRSNTNFGISKTSGTTNASGQDSLTLTAPITPGESTTVTAESGGIVTHVTLTTASIITTHDVLNHWGISNVSTPQTAGSFFDIFVTPYDQYNNVITDYDWSNLANRPVLSGLNSVGGNDPCYNYSSDAGGIATYSITPYAAQTNASITTTLGTANGISNSFNVNHSTATSVTISPLDDTVTAGNTKTYTATAHDTYGNSWNATTDSFFDIDLAAHGSWAANVYTSEIAGNFTVTAHYGSLTDSTSLHVDPSVLHHIIITTTDPTTITAGQTIQFTAHSYDIFGNERTSDVFTWTNANATGLFTNTAAGTYPVQAHSGGIDSDPENVTVEPADLDHIIIVPSTDQTITAGQTITFIAHSYDVYGNERSVDTFTWVGSSAVDSGLFNDTATGNYEVYAMSNGIESNHVNVTVNHAVAISIVLTPDPATILAGETQSYTVTATDTYGNSWNATTDSFFDIFGSGDGGSWIANVYTSHTVGTWTVRTTLGALTEYATLNVNHNVAASIDITPIGPVNLTADQTQQFIATATDAYGNSWNATNEANWYTTDPAGLVANGLYSPVQVGTWTVTATLNGHSDSATVNVTHGVAVSLTIAPDGPLNMTADDTQVFIASAFDADGNYWDVTSSVTWNENDPWGNFSGNTYNAGQVGTWIVFANLGSVNSNNVTVNVSHGDASFFDIFPNDISLTSDQTQQFTATATDSDGNSWDVTSQTTWTTADPAGSINANGLYNPGRVGDWQVRGDYSSLFDISTVHVSHGVTSFFDIFPVGPVNMTADQSQIFTATATDADGNTWDVTSQVVWNENDPVGSFASNTYNAGQAGTWTIFATLGSLNSDNVTVNITHGAVDHITISPSTVDNATSGTVYAFTVLAFDADGNSWDVKTVADYTKDSDDAFGQLNTNSTGGRYTAGQIGTRHVHANYLGKTVSATINIVNHESAPATMQISNTISELMVGNTHQYQVTFRDSFGNSWDGTSLVSWLITAGGSFASIDAGGKVTGLSIGTGVIVQASYTGLTSKTDTFDVIAAVGGTTSSSSSSGSSSVTSANDNSQVFVDDSQGKIKGAEITTVGSEPTAESGKAKWWVLFTVIIALLILAGAYYGYLSWFKADDGEDMGNKPLVTSKEIDRENKPSDKINGKLDEHLRW